MSTYVIFMCLSVLLSLNVIGMHREEVGWMTSRREISTVFNNVCVLIMCVSFPRYFSALSKGECLPVKDRLEMNVATQKTDTGLTPGLLKTLHKQVFSQQLDNTKVMYWIGRLIAFFHCYTALDLHPALHKCAYLLLLIYFLCIPVLAVMPFPHVDH